MILDWKPDSKEVIKKEEKVQEQYLPDFMKPRGLKKLEKRKESKKLPSEKFMDCNEYFAQIITDDLIKNEKEMQSFDE